MSEVLYSSPADTVNAIEQDLIDHIKNLNESIFDNKLNTVESYDEQLASDNIQNNAPQTPAVFVMYAGADDQPIVGNDIYDVTHRFAVICVSDNPASDTARTRETYWLVNRVRKSFRGASISMTDENDQTRKFPIIITGIVPEIRSKALNVFTVGLAVTVKEGENDDPN